MLRTAIVVPGNGRLEAAGYRISARCRRLVVAAEDLAEQFAASAVVFTGWSPHGGPTESEQMRDAWRGPKVELVVEPTATGTAENAARTLPLLRERGIQQALVVCAPLHYLRTRYFFGRLYSTAGIDVRIHTVRVPRSPGALAWELAALPWAPAQLRRALAEVKRA